MDEWIEVNERLPNDREWVLVWHTGYSTPKKAKHKTDLDTYCPIFILDGDNGLDGEVTHWMPLPEPPRTPQKINHGEERKRQKIEWRKINSLEEGEKYIHDMTGEILPR